ncbi:MAG: bifunctional phosphopantothenoylcysteine decarboxylase/phosphopantothenate--cysteine ligase CoaBC [Acidimicrobiales bacterium]|nr:bifunctional phosphopantothenoylcysteine decarboxylase/phosphopantothenate--cysteine ligase CoaBC [Hyphomonadaceae bacterium]RZV44736.1 MAG: bifunctional phosphopantothenoylcysteine decarboxylase/phosphopantothenate--cysteine ligase CoaBC [Acidimicrobiales bacterium]
MTDKSVLLIIGGGIAAYKSLFLIRELARRGVKTRAIITRSGTEFVTPLSVGALTGETVFTDLFDLTQEAEMGHIELSRSTDLVVVAPATADLMAKAVNGLANDLASTTLLATDKRVLYAPAMNVRMWDHPATQRNVATLRDEGALFVGPDEGDMACGEYGLGRMAEPEAIADAIEAALSGETHLDGLKKKPLKNKHILITAGPTREPIDPVRYLSNHSSGKQGYAIAAACAELGADVTLVSGPVSLKSPANVKTVNIETAKEMLKACEKALPADVFISVAAVADWRPSSQSGKKIKKDGKGVPPLMLEENPDILSTLSKHKKRPGLVIGFAAETNDVVKHAKAKLKKKACDWIVANDVSGDVMGGDNNSMILITKNGEDHWPMESKLSAARRLATKISETLS